MVTVQVREHPFFQRDGDDLHVTVRIPMTSAALGTTLKLDTFDGPQEISIPAGTQSGQTRRVEGLGSTRLRSQSGERGDLVVHLEVETPEDLTGEQRELLTRLASLRGEEQHTGTAVSRTQERGGGGGFFSRLRDRFADQ